MTIEVADNELDDICFALGNILLLDVMGAAELKPDAVERIRSIYRRLLSLSKSSKGKRAGNGD